jgi:sugar-specific transcriptional regulator TrmB
MEGVLQHLRNLGFTELEAKCLQVLSEIGMLTGYEIAKRLGVSRSNVYASLQKLVEKGIILESKGEPTHYQSMSMEDIGTKIQTDTLASIRYVQEHMPKQNAERTEYFSMEGDTKIIERIRAELKKTKEEAFIDLWSEEVELFSEDLLHIKEQGIRVLVSSIGGVDLPEIQVFEHVRDEAWQGRNGRKFSLVLDRKLAIIGTRGGSGERTKALLTEHPAMVELLINNFFHDVVMCELQRDMGAKLEEKYGKNFKKIIQKYTDVRNTEIKRRKKK